MVEYASVIGRGGAYQKDFCESVENRSRKLVETAHEGHRSFVVLGGSRVL